MSSAYFNTVQKAYIAFYGRPADPNGLTYWAGKINAAGGNISSIIQAFGTSAEATSIYGGMANAAAVNTLYQQIFGRSADITGLNFYVGKLLDGSYTLVDVAQRIIDGASGTDAAIVANKLTAATSFTNAIDTASEVVGYAGNTAATAARNWLATVSDSASSLTSASGTIDSTLATIAATGGADGAAYTLTSSADTVAGGSSNDTITAAAGTLTSSDTISGGAGTDTLNVTLNSAQTAAAPTMSGVEVVNIDSRTTDGSAGMNFDNITGVQTLTVKGKSVQLSALYQSATVTLEGGYTATLSVDINSGNVSSDSVAFKFNSANCANLVSTDADIVTLTMNQSTTIIGSSTNMSAVSAMTINGSGNVIFNTLHSGAYTAAGQNTAFLALTAVNAGSLSGNLSMMVGSGNTNNLTITGGSGNDTVTFIESFNNSDSFDGGAGTDSLGLAINTAQAIRPALTGVEVIALDVNAALSATFTGVVGTTGLDIRLGAAAAISGLSTAVSTIDVESAGNTAHDLTLVYCATTSAGLTVNLIGGTSTALETASQTTSALSMGDLAVNSATASTLVLNAGGVYTAVTLDSFSTDAKSVSIANARSAVLTFSSGVAVGTATTLSIEAVGNRQVVFSEAVNAPVAGITVNVGAGESSLVDMSALCASIGPNLTITTNSAATGNATMFSADQITFSGDATDSAMNMTAITLNALGGGIKIGTATFDGAGGGGASSAVLDTNIVVNMGDSAFGVTIGALCADNLKTATIRFDVNGSGVFALQSAANNASATQVLIDIDSRDLVSGSLNIGATAMTESVTITMGNHCAQIYAGGSADTITFGIGAQSAWGGAGNDEFVMSTAANVLLMQSGLSLASGGQLHGNDVVINIGTGDIVRLPSATVATFNTGKIVSAGSAFGTTGSAVLNVLNGFTALSCAALASGVTFGGGANAASAVAAPFVVWTAGGDTYIQVLEGTGSIASTNLITTGMFVEYRLDDFDMSDRGGLSASFRVDVSGSAIFLTVL